MPNLIKALFHLATWQKLPMLPRTYSSDYELDEADRDVQMLMSLSHVRCPQGARVLERKHKTPAHELIDQLPQRHRRRRPLKRAVGLIRRALGVTPYDPMRSIYLEHQRRMKYGGRR